MPKDDLFLSKKELTTQPEPVQGDDAYCPNTEDHKHVIDFYSVAPADVDPSELIMDVSCKACGRSGAFRIPDVSEIDW